MRRYIMAFFSRAQDPVSSETHFWGAVASIGALLITLLKGVIAGDTALDIVSSVVFSLSAIALYSASSIYHYCLDNKRFKNKLRKFDHSMIFVLIAGTYTPLCFKLMEFQDAAIFLSIIWFIAIAGIVMKMFWLNAPRTLYTLIYLALGWAIVLRLPTLMAMPLVPFVLLVLGGVSYSVGAVMYILKRPNITLSFGFHELFHIFILLGTLLHFICIMIYVL